MEIKHYLLSILISVSLYGVGQKNEPVNELFYLGVGPGYSLNGNYFGVSGKFAFPMQKGFNFVLQGSLFPSQLNGRYDEFRYNYNVELIPFSIGNLSPYFQVGFNYGYWRRNYDYVYDHDFTNKKNVTLEAEKKFRKDESMLFGWGINYQLKDFIFFAEHKYYPKIYGNNFSAGIKVLFFENKLRRQLYHQKRKLKRKTKS